MPDISTQDDRSPTPPPPIGALRSLAQKRKQEPRQVEHCELCSEIIPSSHSHLLNLSSRALVCTCQTCTLLFSCWICWLAILYRVSVSSETSHRQSIADERSRC